MMKSCLRGGSEEFLGARNPRFPRIAHPIPPQVTKSRVQVTGNSLQVTGNKILLTLV